MRKENLPNLLILQSVKIVSRGTNSQGSVKKIAQHASLEPKAAPRNLFFVRAVPVGVMQNSLTRLIAAFVQRENMQIQLCRISVRSACLENLQKEKVNPNVSLYLPERIKMEPGKPLPFLVLMGIFLPQRVPQSAPPVLKARWPATIKLSA